MSNSPKEPPVTRDPAIIASAPIAPDDQDFNADESAFFDELVGELAAENQELKAEVERLKGRKTFDDVRAAMMQPYADKVFSFLVSYCGFVALVILLNGFPCTGFKISDVVLGVIAGSTAVAAIGLVGFVVSGLFGIKAKEG